MTYHATRTKGVAVIMVLLVLAIVAVTTSALVKRHQFNQAMASQVIHLGQAKAHIQGAEHFAHQLLRQDRQANNIDHQGESWAQIAPPIAVEQGFLNGSIVDLQGKLNLNSLVVDDQLHQPSVAVFKRLLDQHQLKSQLSDYLVDWLDSNVETKQGTLEDSYYLALKTPYRSANQSLLDLSELALVRGFDTDTVAVLEPYVTALPLGSKNAAKVNVNSASAGLLMAMSGAIGQNKAQQLITSGKLDYWPNVTKFVDAAVGQKSIVNNAQWQELSNMVTVSSDYFGLNVAAQFGVATTQLKSTLHRNDSGTITVISRMYTPL
ncbi:MAG: type II secretion system minor pseudopilin GspK [Oceanospirillaceae bacterium]|nr:type II secretion system minor pseudopilin GspK [Oceanospirillaceae bacterium]